ncbi:serine/threonine-protein kinase Nek2-like [Styela clava]
MPSKLCDYDILYTIGSGSYGKCLKIRRKSDGKTLVWKEMDYGSMTEPEKQQLVSEVNLLRELKHKYIVRYYDRIIDRTSSRLYLVMEYCSGGDLASIISKKRKERSFMEENFILRVFAQLVLALQECHSQRKKLGQGKILHRDLKPANVFLDSSNDVKLGDFGLARVLNHDTSFAKTFVGTPYYMSPEQMNKLSYNEKSDIWSLGCLIYELCALLPPFTAANQRLLAVKIKEGKFRRIPSKYSDELQDCISLMLKTSAARRPTIDEILKMDLLQDTLEKCGLTPPVSPAALKPQVGIEVIEDKKMERRKSSSSSDSSESEKRESPEPEGKTKEEGLELRLREIEKKERELKRREKLLEERERMAEEKMTNAETLIKQYREMKAEKQDLLSRAGLSTEALHEKYERLGILPSKKQVHFAMESKENNPGYHDDYRYRKLSGVGPISDKHLGDYRHKLRDLRLQNQANMRYENNIKNRHLLGMR